MPRWWEVPWNRGPEAGGESPTAAARERFIRGELEGIFRDWACWTSQFGAVAFILMSPLDYLSNPEHFTFFFFLRLAGFGGLLLLAGLLRRAQGRYARRFWVAGSVALSSGIIEVMILHFGGEDSPYFAGQILLGVVTLGLLPASSKFNVIIAAIIHGTYTIPLLFAGVPPTSGGFVIQNFLLFNTLAAILFVGYIGRNQLCNRIGLAWDLTQQDRHLESQVRERTRQLAQINEEWRATVDSTGDAIMAVNESGLVARANLACAQLAGKKLTALNGSSAVGLLAGLGLAPEASPLGATLRTGARGRTEFWSPAARRWFQVTSDPTKSGTVFLAGAVVTIRDITDVREMQQAILSAGKEWEETFDSIHEGITIHGPDFRIRRSNAAARQLVGGMRSPEGAVCHEIFHARDCVVAGCPGRRAMETGRPSHREFFEPHLGRYLEVTCLPRPNGGFIHVVRDITELKRSIEEIREAGIRRQIMLEKAPFGVFMVNAGLGVEFANPAILNIIGYTREQFVGGCLGELPGCAEVGLEEPVRKALEGAPFRLGPTAFRCFRGGREIIARFTGTPLEEEGKRKVLVFVEDLTELKQAEGEQQRLNALLLQVQKMESVGTLASGIAHDFNNVLLATIGLSDAAMEKLPAMHPAREDLESVVRAAERGSNLVRQILAFSSQQDLQLIPLRLDTMIRETAGLLSHVLPRNIRVEIACDESLPPVTADPVQMEQVLMNLAVNARDAMPDGGRLAIRTGPARVLEGDLEHPGIPAGAYAVMTVSDTGTGIPSELQPRIFDPFFTTKGAGKGTGLGLATVYGIVGQHGGGIRVESTPGHGATFKVYLPLGEDALTPGDPPVPEGTETVLVVEDDPAIVDILSRKLASLGYAVLSAYSGDEALEVCAAAEAPVHALLCDVVIPGRDARGVVEELRRRYPGIKVIFMSGHPGEFLRRKGLVGDDDLLLTKALGPLSLIRKLREELDRA